MCCAVDMCRCLYISLYNSNDMFRFETAQSILQESLHILGGQRLVCRRGRMQWNSYIGEPTKTWGVLRVSLILPETYLYLFLHSLLVSPISLPLCVAFVIPSFFSLFLLNVFSHTPFFPSPICQFFPSHPHLFPLVWLKRYTLVPCKYSGTCGKVRKMNIEAHETTCEFRPEMCKYCKADVQFHDMEVRCLPLFSPPSTLLSSLHVNVVVGSL